MQQLGCKTTARVAMGAPTTFGMVSLLSRQHKKTEGSWDIFGTHPNGPQNPAGGHVQHHGKSSTTPESVIFSGAGFQ